MDYYILYKYGKNNEHTHSVVQYSRQDAVKFAQKKSKECGIAQILFEIGTYNSTIQGRVYRIHYRQTFINGSGGELEELKPPMEIYNARVEFDKLTTHNINK